MSFLGISKSPLELGHNGKTYELSPLGFAELGKFVLWYKWKEFEEAKLLVANLEDKELARQILSESYNTCKNKRWKYFASPQDELEGKYSEAEISWEAPEIQKFSSSVEGIAKQLELSLKIKHPEVTSSLCSQIVNLGNYQEVLHKLYEVNGVKAEELGETNPNQ